MKVAFHNKVLLWDRDGTITGSRFPLDVSPGAQDVLPGVEGAMQSASLNFIISGITSQETEAQDFDREAVITLVKKLMEKLPVHAAVFSPKRRGIECYALIRKPDGSLVEKVMHEDPRYAGLVGQFRKPATGMLQVVKDLAHDEFGVTLTADNSLMIGDTWHDEYAAAEFGVPFLNASVIHTSV